MTRARFLALAALALVASSACVPPRSRREASLERARAAAVGGDLERAAEILRAARAYDPRDRQVAARVAGVYEESGAYARALGLLESFPEAVQEPAGGHGPSVKARPAAAGRPWPAWSAARRPTTAPSAGCR